MSILSEILPKKEITNYFIVLGLEERYIRAAVAEITGNRVRILGIGKSEFNEVENEIEAVDIAISMAEKTVPEKLLIHNVIFALPQFYLEGENVKPEYLIRLKKIAKELDLKAYGFVDYVSSIINYLETTESSPPTVLLMDLSSEFMTLSLVRVGKIQQHIIVKRSDSIVNDFSSSLPQFEADILPSKIIIFDFSDKSEELREELLRFPWHKHSIFLHTPKIEIFTNEKIMTAVVEAAATSFLPNISETLPKISREETLQAETEVSEPESVSEELEKAETDQKGEKFGFIQETLNEKIATIKKETKPIDGKFVAGKIELQKVSAKLRDRISKIKFGYKGIILGIPPALIVILLIYLIWNYPTASVSLITYPLPQQYPMEILFAKDNAQGSGNLPVISIRSITNEISGDKSAKSTGTTLMGDKARGEVTIYNKTTTSKTLARGTILISGPLKFTLDEEVKIASAGETSEGITFGKSTAKITAAAIGPEANLAGNSNFTFSEFSEAVTGAKNSLPLSGGTSREITSVSKEDRDNLEEQLTAELVKQAKQKILGNINPRERILDSPITTTVSSKKFNSEVGSEAKDLTLNLTLKVEGFVYNQAELEKLINPQALTVPAGYTFDPTKTTVKLEKSDADKNGNISAKVAIIAYFIPDLNLNQIKKDMRGKSYSEALAYLEKIDKVGGVKISQTNKLPFLSKKLPFKSQNITISIVSR
ncbi:hypothetical protein A3D78_06145 [Candidatus Gottesmanbacteria bacterium RIFCSPHIGHO2_02_FULL_39_14]|uniref:Baseplate protein J-like domain-containing protein n=2 Tax=Candidatus Gottesmaniibacteriota TaxID=1752720 RepID=A0A1F5ZYJ8_9BACT|nr:MAG: hypothetical protein A2153_01720 [Candidatus Gottesmanbacteria bacterium RBG_16_38_7b]OGG17434.1 MAG: hypothetical protein A3D78_06145 [Candidatus Gottesmanbacteria bacterium RIFCSPHIGHO2_02_FULL_39_14]